MGRLGSRRSASRALTAIILMVTGVLLVACESAPPPRSNPPDPYAAPAPLPSIREIEARVRAKAGVVIDPMAIPTTTAPAPMLTMRVVRMDFPRATNLREFWTRLQPANTLGPETASWRTHGFLLLRVRQSDITPLQNMLADTIGRRFELSDPVGEIDVMPIAVSYDEPQSHAVVTADGTRQPQTLEPGTLRILRWATSSELAAPGDTNATNAPSLLLTLLPQLYQSQPGRFPFSPGDTWYGGQLFDALRIDLNIAPDDVLIIGLPADEVPPIVLPQLTRRPSRSSKPAQTQPAETQPSSTQPTDASPATQPEHADETEAISASDTAPPATQPLDATQRAKEQRLPALGALLLSNYLMNRPMQTVLFIMPERRRGPVNATQPATLPPPAAAPAPSRTTPTSRSRSR